MISEDLLSATEQAAIAVWRKLPRPVVNAIGPHIARHLG